MKNTAFILIKRIKNASIKSKFREIIISMKQINKLIYGKIIEISVLIAIILVSFPLWKKLDIKDYLSTAAFYEEAQYSYLEIENYPIDLMYPISTIYAIKNLQPTIIKVKNETLTQEDYTLTLKIAKDSSLDYNCLNISLNNKVKSLKETLISEDEENFYFSLASDTIIGEEKEYKFLIWMDEKTGNEMQGKTLNYDFELQKKIAV